MSAQRASRTLLFSILALLSLMLFAGQGAAAKSAEEHWANSGLKLEMLLSEDLVSEKNCYSAAEKFRACVAAMTALAVSGASPQILMPRAEYEKFSDEFEKITYSDDQMVLVQVKEKPQKRVGQNGIEAFNLAKARLALRTKALNEVYETRKNLRSGDRFKIFKHVADTIHAEMAASKKYSMIIAQAVNQYLEKAVDPHTAIHSAELLKERSMQPNERFVGIGAELTKTKDGVLIFAVVPNSPAAQAGLKRGDMFLRINETDVKDKGLNEVVDLVRGEPGTKISLEMLRGKTNFKFQVTRAQVEFRNVQIEGIGKAQTKMGYIRLREFASPTDCLQIRATLHRMENHQIAGLVFDLRGNVGGFLDVGICIAASFVDANALLRSGRSLGHLIEIATQGKVPFATLDSISIMQNQFQMALSGQAGVSAVHFTNLPVVVLVDSDSASASEIVSGILQDLDRAWIVGQRTFGKGTAQDGRPGWKGLKTIRLMETKERFYLPSGRTPQLVGITPDFEALRTPQTKESENVYAREENLYDNPFAADATTKWQPRRLARVAKISDCLKKTGEAEKVFHEAEARGELLPDDYQLMKAQDVLLCEIITR